MTHVVGGYGAMFHWRPEKIRFFYFPRELCQRQSASCDSPCRFERAIHRQRPYRVESNRTVEPSAVCTDLNSIEQQSRDPNQMWSARLEDEACLASGNFLRPWWDV